jgi:rubrerythrin
LVSNRWLKEQLNKLAKDEERHLQVAKDIIGYVIASGITA